MAGNLLTGTNVKLRALEPSDIDTLYAWENDTSIWNVSNTMAPFSRHQIEEYILNARQDIYALRQLRLMIDLHGSGVTGQSVGTIDLFDYEPMHRRAGIGILVVEQFRKQGHAREALEIMVKYSFKTLNLRQLYCNISPDNISSIRLFKQCGFARCGIKREWNFTGSKWRDEWMFQLIRQDERES